MLEARRERVIRTRMASAHTHPAQVRDSGFSYDKDSCVQCFTTPYLYLSAVFIQLMADDILSETARSLGISLTFLPDTGEWPVQTSSLSALLSPAHVPSMESTTMAGLGLSTDYCGVNKLSSNRFASSFEHSSRWRQRVQSSPWIFLTSRLIRTTVDGCSIM